MTPDQGRAHLHPVPPLPTQPPPSHRSEPNREAATLRDFARLTRANNSDPFLHGLSHAARQQIEETLEHVAAYAETIADQIQASKVTLAAAAKILEQGNQ